MATLERAIELAARGHARQKDKAGEPYILHPLRVMFSLQDEKERIVAVLHDLIEDTAFTLRDLNREGFAADVIEAVEALTKRPSETRVDAAHRAATNPLARAVKLADIADNMNLNRIAEPSERDIARLAEYEQVQQILLAAQKPN